MKTSKRILLWLTLVAMIVTLAALTLPVDAATYQGSCGVTVDWSLDTATGVLTISGSGDMYDYDGSTDVPWNNRAHLIKSVEIKDCVRSIGAHAFFSCRNLTSITIPNTVSKLGDYAFGYCTGLETVTFGNDVRNLGEAVFYECTSLTAIEVPEDNPVYKSVDGVLYSKGGTFFIQYPIGKQADSYTIANGVIDIKNHAFSHSTLSQVKIPNSVELIEKNAFADCGKLKSIQLPSGLLRINDGAFARCNSLKTVILGGKVKKLGEGVFRGCLYLTSVS